MLVVSGLRVSFGAKNLHSSPGMQFTLASIDSMTLVVTMKDTQTGETRDITNVDGASYFLAELRLYQPYGFIDLSIYGDYSFITLVVIDDKSLEFLGFVDKIEIISVTSRDEMRSLVCSLVGHFEHLCEDMSILKTQGAVCTLYHAMCRRPKGWYKDDFYLFAFQNASNVPEKYITWYVYKISFCDLPSAKRWMTRAMTLGFDPVGKQVIS